jgi:hypothetical protein
MIRDGPRVSQGQAADRRATALYVLAQPLTPYRMDALTDFYYLILSKTYEPIFRSRHFKPSRFTTPRRDDDILSAGRDSWAALISLRHYQRLIRLQNTYHCYFTPIRLLIFEAEHRTAIAILSAIDRRLRRLTRRGWPPLLSAVLKCHAIYVPSR